jgi:hypothetical protein
MGVTCEVGIIDYSVSDECGGSSDNGGKGRGGEEGKEKKRREKKRNNMKKLEIKGSGTREGSAN